MYRMQTCLPVILLAHLMLPSFLHGQLPAPIHPVNTKTARTDTNHDTNADKKSSTKSQKESGASKEKVQAKSDAKSDIAPKQKLTKQQLRNYLKNILTGIGLAGAVLIMASNDALDYLFGKTSQAVSSAGEQSKSASRSIFTTLFQPTQDPAPREESDTETSRVRWLRILADATNGHFDLMTIKLCIDPSLGVVDYRAHDTDPTLLMLAARHDKRVVILTLLMDNADINLTDGHARTALMHAVMHDSANAVKELIGAEEDDVDAELFVRRGAKVNLDMRDRHGATALYHAVSRRNGEIARLLLDGKANPNIANNEDTTPLLCAVNNNDEDGVRLLLERNADPNRQDNKGITALVRASANNNETTVELLMEHRADITSVDSGNIALLASVLNGNTSLTQKLLKYNANPNTATKDGYTPIIPAAQTGRCDLLRLLLDHNADPNHVTEEGDTALMKAAAGNVAAVGNHVGVLHMLLDSQVPINFVNQHGETALMQAAKNKTLEAVQTLLARNADPNLPNPDGAGALHAAALVLPLYKPKYHAITEALLNAQANIHAKNEEGETALHYAAFTGCQDTIELLLSRDADPNAEDISGRKAWQHARTEEIRQLLGGPEEQPEAGAPGDEEKGDDEEIGDSSEEEV